MERVGVRHAQDLLVRRYFAVVHHTVLAALHDALQILQVRAQPLHQP